MKNRVILKGNDIYEVRRPGEAPEEFEIREMMPGYDPESGVAIELGIGDDKWALYWEDMWVGDYTYKTPAEVEIIRFAYGLEKIYAIPSECLRALNLMHRHVWVDSFIKSEVHAPDNEIEYAPNDDIKPPESRLIRVVDPVIYHDTPSKHKKKAQAPKRPTRIVGERLVPCARDWEDDSDPLFGWINMRDTKTGYTCRKPDHECVTTLTAGIEAIEVFGDPE